MKKSEVHVGKTYWANVTGERVPVRIESDSPRGGWVGRSIKTGREVRIKTAGRLHGECEAEAQATVARETRPNRRSRRKPPEGTKTRAKAQPKADPRETRKANKQNRRDAILEAVAKVLSSDPKKALTVGEIHAALIEAGIHESCGNPTHGAIFYALKIDIERNPKTRFASNNAEIGASYYLRKTK